MNQLVVLPAPIEPAPVQMESAGCDLRPSSVLPPDWARILRVDDLLGEMTISCFCGTTEQSLDVEASGPAMFCIGIFIKGNARMALAGGESLCAGPGMAVVQTAARPSFGHFSMDGGDEVRMVDIRFTPEGFVRAGGRPMLALQGQFLRDCSVAQPQYSLLGGFPAPLALLRVAEQILDCDFEEADVRALYLRAKALEALALVLRELGPPAQRIAGRERQRLLEARRLLDARYAEDWTLERLAREVGLNEKKLQAGFRAMAGRTVHAHLREVRMDAAAAMLAGGVSVTDAAYAVGFSSLSHFSKAFRQVRGCSPRVWQPG
jgi:AraC-like DNA-binding protein